jgi:hypothetical protein
MERKSWQAEDDDDDSIISYFLDWRQEIFEFASPCRQDEHKPISYHTVGKPIKKADNEKVNRHWRTWFVDAIYHIAFHIKNGVTSPLHRAIQAGSSLVFCPSVRLDLSSSYKCSIVQQVGSYRQPFEERTENYHQAESQYDRPLQRLQEQSRIHTLMQNKAFVFRAWSPWTWHTPTQDFRLCS